MGCARRGLVARWPVARARRWWTGRTYVRWLGGWGGDRNEAGARGGEVNGDRRLQQSTF